MPDLHAKVSTTWKRIAGVFVRVGGAWKRVQNIYVRAGGSWKLVHSFAGQMEWSTAGTYSVIVPAGVTSIHAAVVGGAGNTLSDIRRGATTLIACTSAVNTAFGGGAGGTAPTAANSGGGGAGGYSGDGGAGAPGSEGVYSDGYDATGGGGGGGASGATTSARHHGAGVYLHGAGANGAGGKRSGNVSPTAGSNLAEGVPRGAGRHYVNSSNVSLPGGDLRYTKTAITVTPGETLTVRVGAKPATSGTDEMQGGVRIIWGPGRSYPNNAKDV